MRMKKKYWKIESSVCSFHGCNCYFNPIFHLYRCCSRLSNNIATHLQLLGFRCLLPLGYFYLGQKRLRLIKNNLIYLSFTYTCIHAAIHTFPVLCDNYSWPKLNTQFLLPHNVIIKLVLTLLYWGNE